MAGWASSMDHDVSIVDVGLGNHASVANMVQYVGGIPHVVREPRDAVGAKIILPGVGAFDRGMAGLQSAGWTTFLQDSAEESDILGICLGMQLLGLSSDEGIREGVGLIPMRFARFDSTFIRVPHMGWNDVRPVRPDPLFADADAGWRFYFAHSFRAKCDDESVVALTTYGDDFPAVVRKGRVAGVQFHPEKSHMFGIRLISAFLGSGRAA